MVTSGLHYGQDGQMTSQLCNWKHSKYQYPEVSSIFVWFSDSIVGTASGKREVLGLNLEYVDFILFLIFNLCRDVVYQGRGQWLTREFLILQRINTLFFERMELWEELEFLLLQVQILIWQLHALSLYYGILYIQIMILSRMLWLTALLPVPTFL